MAEHKNLICNMCFRYSLNELDGAVNEFYHHLKIQIIIVKWHNGHLFYQMSSKSTTHLYYKTESQLCPEKALLGLTNQRRHAEIKTYGIPPN